MITKISGFPKVPHKCEVCDGSGIEDVSYHGSPIYEDCSRCEGVKGVIYYREMTIREKLDYLLAIVMEGK